jgi:hypothetical protein
MVLKGEARNRYMREYMRRRRAAQTNRPPTPATAEREALKVELAQAHERIRALEALQAVGGVQEATERGGPSTSPPSNRTTEELDAARPAAMEPRKAQRATKIEKPQAVPTVSEELAKRDRRIKQLTTQVQNLKQQLACYDTEGAQRPRILSYSIYTKVLRFVHPESKWTNETDREAARNEVYELLTAWGANPRTKDRANS